MVPQHLEEATPSIALSLELPVKRFYLSGLVQILGCIKILQYSQSVPLHFKMLVPTCAVLPLEVKISLEQRLCLSEVSYCTLLLIILLHISAGVPFGRHVHFSLLNHD